MRKLAVILMLVVMMAGAKDNFPEGSAVHLSDTPTNAVLNQKIVFYRAYNYLSGKPRDLVERVNLDLSLDSGKTWTYRIATGIPCKFGRNEFNWSFTCTPDMWTEHARISVRTLWGSTAEGLVEYEGGMSKGDFSIGGVRVLAPTNGQTVLQPGYLEVAWHEAGAEMVDIGISTNAGKSFNRLYTVESPNPTNSLNIAIWGVPTGRLDIIVSDVRETHCYGTVQVNVVNQ